MRSARTTPILALVAPTLVVACTSQRPKEPTPPPSPSAPATDERPELANVAADRLAHGDWHGAHAALSELLVDERVDEARQILADGRPEDALLVLDEARAIDPERRDVDRVFADAAYAMGEQGLGSLWFEDALDAYRRSGDDRAAHVGAGRSAFMLFRFDEALEHARKALALPPEPNEELPERPLELLARAGTFGQAEARDASDVERADAIVADVRDALAAALVEDPLDPWIPAAAGTLFESAGKLELARDNVERGLDRMPEEPSLHQRLAEIVYRVDDDYETAIATFERVTANHPEVALGHWYLARARFDAALAAFERDPGDGEGGEGATAGDDTERTEAIVARYRAAEADFERCAELDPETAEACDGWRALCRNGRAWCHFDAGELERAQEAFLSMNDVLEDGIEWQLEGRLPNGIRGLEFIVGAHNEAGDFARAAETSERLRELQPDEVKWANNAGFFHRDAGTALEDRARRFRSAAAHLRGTSLPVDATDPQAIGRPELEWTDEALALLRAEVGFDETPAVDVEVSAYRTLAGQLEARARDHFEHSYAAYQAAVELSPDDVRIVNDTALIAVYHLGRDLDRAEELLMRCVELGAEQTAGQEKPTSVDDEHFDLWNAWGDAHQNLGVLEMRHRDAPGAAIPWFRRSLEIGPLPRPACAILIERCEERLDSNETSR